ncbi:helix-turn-helix domain-containing protein [Anaerosolibacter sp.]|uniref:helix-turn-helix domain-containing protein n=1 Tax=Anaerosolibacter sp. TaxID=1872527 RepID=UPI00262C912A|nr:helix-turn-helix domain-containing protein [Anaerosolibacter sp.]
MRSNEISENIVYNNPLQPVRIIHECRHGEGSGPWHYHHELELITIIKGEFCIFTKELAIKLKAGDVAVIGSLEPHYSFKEAGDMEYIVLQFDIFRFISQDLISYMKYFTEDGRLLSRLNYMFREKPQVNEKIYRYIVEIASEHAQKQKGYEIAIHSLIHRIILEFLRNDSSALLDVNSSIELQKLLPVLEYVEKNIDSRITMEEAAKYINYDYYYFGKYFKRVIGKTFKEYVNNKKMVNVERILLTKNVTIMEAALSVGMPNMANFYKAFREYNNCSPKDFRDRALNRVTPK